MSIAGIRSNRGDGYQTLVAFDWALLVLSDPDFEWLEVDSVQYSVDDVVIGKADGTLIACQCKKNQPDFRAWTISDLGEELDKAFYLLASNPKVNVRFYSRSNFGDLAKLKEHCLSQPDEVSYLKSLGKAQSSLNKILTDRLKKKTNGLSAFDFLLRTNFIVTEDLDQMGRLLRGRLRNIVSNNDAAFNALWVSIEKLGARIGGGSSATAAMHRLTKSDLGKILQQAGAMLVPPKDIAELRQSFSSTSIIGRSWRRDIAGHHISNPIMEEILAAIDNQHRSILLTGLPGSGKTCVMLELLEILEERAKKSSYIMPLFIQSREFADLATPEERQAQGLSNQWVEEAARLAESTRVIVVIDSLDVLSIAREHRVLQYFLAQIDRLLLIPNLTVVTACREFDKHYDRRIAERNWECELKCQPLNWDLIVTPLLDSLGIKISDVDDVTRKLICNPRELSLFTELALRDGSFNVVTSQALAQRYLKAIVLADRELGDIAVQAIEMLAKEMLRLRSLSVPHQRFNASQSIQRKLCSLNVLQETQDGKLTFGHQTLLDILVISRAIRDGVTLNEFINSLPPVPFVRPSIRTFIAQLALDDRREFRKQLRTVLTGNAAFHIRRLSAESYAEQKPQDEDWHLVRDLRLQHRDVFQIIYSKGSSVEWHRFWINYLIPHLIMLRDVDGLKMHMHHIAQWSNIDTAGVVAFWTDTFAIAWFDGNEVANQLAIHLSRIKPDNLAIIAPLLKSLLAMPRTEYSSLGWTVAPCVTAGILQDAELWRYITEALTDQDLQAFRFNHKLRCQSHEFGNQTQDFLHKRMLQSTDLLSLALNSIEQWSSVRSLRFGSEVSGYRDTFLNDSSFSRTHNQSGIHTQSALEILLDAVEAGIINHAKYHTEWWQKNCERICFNHEGALLYMGIQACTSSVAKNINLIGRMLCDREMLEFKLIYEISGLIAASFSSLPYVTQDAVMESILNIYAEHGTKYSNSFKLRSQAELITAIPCYLRSADIQLILDKYDLLSGELLRQPRILSVSGYIIPPFSHTVFHEISDQGILILLNHYRDGSQRDEFEFLVGGTDQVGQQLQVAASLQPSRFINFLSFNWSLIPNHFYGYIMTGISRYLDHRYGNLGINGEWNPIEEPNPQHLAEQILNELERHPKHWQLTSYSASALEACANVIQDQKSAVRLIFLAIGFAGYQEVNSVEGDKDDLISTGISMKKGDVINALMILACNFLEQGHPLPQLLFPVIRRFATDENSAVRALILMRLPFIQYKSSEAGWDIFHLVMRHSQGLWQHAERCLYNAYNSHNDIVRIQLNELRCKGSGKDLETWGRISALSTLSGHIDFNQLICDLTTINAKEAWSGAALVWTNIENIQQHREQCLAGMEAGLNADYEHSLTTAQHMGSIFDIREGVIFIPENLISHCFSVFKRDCSDEKKHHRLYNFDKWLNAISQQDPELALTSAEVYLDYIRFSKHGLFDHGDNFTQLMTYLFAVAEEKDESDGGAMIQRVVALQDLLLAAGLEGVAQWLKAAERP